MVLFRQKKLKTSRNSGRRATIHTNVVNSPFPLPPLESRSPFVRLYLNPHFLLIYYCEWRLRCLSFMKRLACGHARFRFETLLFFAISVAGYSVGGQNILGTHLDHNRRFHLISSSFFQLRSDKLFAHLIDSVQERYLPGSFSLQYELIRWSIHVRRIFGFWRDNVL